MASCLSLDSAGAPLLPAGIVALVDEGEVFFWDASWEWFLIHGIPILAIVAIALVLYWVARLAIPHVVERSVRFSGKDKRAGEYITRRVHTLSNLLVNVTGIAIGIIAMMTVFDQMNIPIAPLLTSAGIVGIAIGLGAQSLVKDLISGVFILMENQYNRGDVVTVAGVTGTVEEVSLRRTVLRDSNGTLHSIPNSAISLTSNYTRDLSRINLDLPVGYDTDLDLAMNTINRIGEELAKDKRFRKLILSPPRALRINNFANSGIEIKVTGDTAPGAQWEVAGEFRRRIKQAFDAEGIEIPWPHVKIHLAGEPIKSCPNCQRRLPQGATRCLECEVGTNPPST